MGRDRYTNDQRQQLLLNYPTLTSIGGDIWNVTALELLDSVGSAGLPRLKSIERPGCMKDLLTLL
jgi:NADPH-dependent 7-cyano-7-deazaguanine reductase QueF-like protein